MNLNAESLEAESLEAEFVKNGCKRINDRIACECVKVICQDIDPSWEVKAACEVERLKQLSPMTASCDQKPDIIILSDDVVGFTEVHYSPMVHTITKSCIGAADFLRLQRAQGVDIREITSFALPKCALKRCSSLQRSGLVKGLIRRTR